MQASVFCCPGKNYFNFFGFLAVSNSGTADNSGEVFCTTFFCFLGLFGFLSPIFWHSFIFG
ncbi:MAG: hypothetical protein RR227_07165, partial [Oscillospiraceae bacterium]